VVPTWRGENLRSGRLRWQRGAHVTVLKSICWRGQWWFELRGAGGVVHSKVAEVQREV